jgi:hypothetical protein
MYTALASAGATPTGFSFPRLFFLIVLLAVGLPVVRTLRRSASARRRARWVKEGLLDPPAPDPEAGDPRTSGNPSD